MAQEERFMQQVRYNQDLRQQYKINYASEQQQAYMHVTAQSRTRDLNVKKYEEQIEQIKKANELHKQEHLQELMFKQ